ncbi:hypothetical protein EYF80_062130 [Liparis tanakae]|uniref:Uncharacterized protein n=1 Tax=Liparis tanakae TaxID=230148 RepID=A0A4Z2EGW8_9TELE|nr:hypothetical protein EYF80_062130 [Liparis tanakae]
MELPNDARNATASRGLTRARGREEARLVLMGGINQLVKLPVSNHRGAPRRAGPGRGSFSPVHQRPHEARGFIPRPHGPPVLPNRLRRTVSIGAVCGLVNTGAQTRGSDRGPLHPGDKEAQHFAVVADLRIHFFPFLNHFILSFYVFKLCITRQIKNNT